MAVDPEERRFLLNQLSLLTISDLRGVWQASSDLDSASFSALIAEAFPEVVAPYVAAASELAATWYELAAPELNVTALTTSLPVERLEQSVSWALGAEGEQGLARLEGSAQRAVFDGARETTLINVAQEPGSRWVRHARPGACAFCRLMANRHTDRRFWYRSAKSAVDVVGRTGSGRQRGKRAVGSRGYHDHCHCIAVEVRPGQEYEPPEYVQEWQDEYYKARANAGSGDPRKILAAWRQQGVK